MQPNYPPQGYPQYPQGYPQAAPAPQQQPATVPNPAATLDPSNPFSDPTGGGSISPKARDLVGRTIIVEPLGVDENATFKDAKRPSARFHLWVVDGAFPLFFGDNLDTRSPHTHRIDGPARFANAISANAGFVNEVRNKLGKGISLAVVEQGTKGNRPYLLTPVDTTLDGAPRPDAAQRRAAALKMWNDFNAGARFAEPVELNPPNTAPAGYGTVNYGAQQQYQQPPLTPQFSAPTPQQVASQQPYPGGPVEQYNNPSAPYVEQYPGQHAQAQTMNTAAMATAQQSAPPAPDINTPPPGWAPEVWSTFTPEQRQAILARSAPVGGPATGPGI